MSGWQILPGTDASAAQQFADLDAVFALEGQIVAADSMTRTLRIEIDGRHYYVKRYAGLGKKPLRRWFATPRVQLEWENLAHFAAWGIPTAKLVAYGLESRAGRFVRGALITAEIPNTTDLGKLARTGDPRLKSRRWQDGIMRQVAAITRQMHDRRFAHGDLKWRNLLVDGDDRVFLIDCPSGAFWWPPFLEYRIVKDLACLDKLGKIHLSRTRRLRFYLAYAQKNCLDEGDKQRIRKIVAFFTGRDDVLASAASLRAAGRNVLPRVEIALEDGQPLAIERWLRILPGKRLTGIGIWNGRKVLAKLFIAARGSERHWQRECEGAATLQSAGLPTATMLAKGKLAGEGHFVLYDYLADARNPDPNVPAELVQVFATLGRMHARGLLQEDAHLDNFLLRAGLLHVVDGAAIRPIRSNDDGCDNLALLFAQLKPEIVRELHDALLAAYRGENPAASIDVQALASAITSIRHARLRDYLDKSLRDCSLFKSAQRTDKFFSIVRAETGLLAPLIHDPDAWLEKGLPLKRGRTATLALVEVGGRQLVIKRYNIKSAGHALSRCWRPSRAWHAWIAGHRLQFLGIPSPRPLALVEHRFGPLRGRAWLITEYCSGENLAVHLEGHLDSPPVATLEAIQNLFAQLAEAHISHGDLKATNLLWYDGKIQLVDLDAMRQHDSQVLFARAWAKDRARLLRNWPSDSALHTVLDGRLPPA